MAYALEKILASRVDDGKNLPHALLDLEAEVHEKYEGRPLRDIVMGPDVFADAALEVASQKKIPWNIVKEQIHKCAEAGDPAALRLKNAVFL